MRLQQFALLPLSAIALAEEQQPLGDKLKGWFNKAASYVPTTVPSVPNPVHAASAKVAASTVTNLNRRNWKELIRAGPPTTTGEPDEWLVYFDGGNKTCYGRCENATLAFNASAALLQTASKPPSLARVDCDRESVLCLMWGASPPSLYHVLLPQNSDPILRYQHLNTSSVTATEIVELSTKRKFESIEPTNGIKNPFTGTLAKFGVSEQVAVVQNLFAGVPSWVPMVLISLISRRIMHKQAPRQAELHQQLKEATGQVKKATKGDKAL